MKQKTSVLAALFLASGLCCGAQEAHITLAGREVAMWKPGGPAAPEGYPLIVFSHGFTGCNTQSKFLMGALARAGYLVLAPNHQDAGCGTARRAGRRRPKPQEPFREAGRWSEQTYRDRRDDIEAVLDAVFSKNGFAGVRVDGSRIGLAGHSLGGYTVLGLAGGWASWKDPRIKAVLALSPHCSPFAAKGQLGQMKIPVMYQGGTRDLGETPLLRQAGGAYEQSAKPKFYVELRGAGHFAWSDVNRRYVSTIAATSRAFFDAYLKQDATRLESLIKERPFDVSQLRAAF
jgi:predicted dienelactone hydrolase